MSIHFDSWLLSLSMDRIEKLWRDAEGKAWGHGHKYYRIEDTHIKSGQKFYDNELAISPLVESFDMETVLGVCWVMRLKTYLQGRPVDCVEEADAWVVEYRYSETSKSWTKLKSRDAWPTATHPTVFQDFAVPFLGERRSGLSPSVCCIIHVAVPARVPPESTAVLGPFAPRRPVPFEAVAWLLSLWVYPKSLEFIQLSIVQTREPSEPFPTSFIPARVCRSRGEYLTAVKQAGKQAGKVDPFHCRLWLLACELWCGVGCLGRVFKLATTAALCCSYCRARIIDMGRKTARIVKTYPRATQDIDTICCPVCPNMLDGKQAAKQAAKPAASAAEGAKRKRKGAAGGGDASIAGGGKPKRAKPSATNESVDDAALAEVSAAEVAGGTGVATAAKKGRPSLASVLVHLLKQETTMKTSSGMRGLEPGSTCPPCVAHSQRPLQLSTNMPVMPLKLNFCTMCLAMVWLQAV